MTQQPQTPAAALFRLIGGLGGLVLAIAVFNGKCDNNNSMTTQEYYELRKENEDYRKQKAWNKLVDEARYQDWKASQ